MKVTQLNIQYFRAFKEKKLSFGTLTLLVGGNGAGKTSIIEGLYLLSHGESFRAGKIEEMVAFNEPLARVKAVITDNQAKDELEVTLTRGLVQGKRTPKRLFAVNGAGKRRQNFIGRFLTVVFQPEDMRLIEGSPQRRRGFVDSVLSLTSVEYVRSLHVYDQALKRYNRLIDQVRDRKQPASVLTYWEMLMVKHGEILQNQRQEFFEFLHHTQAPFSFDIRYQISLISAAAIESHRERAIAAGHALIGPHKDDFAVLFPGEIMENRELSAYGSRGQQRLGVLWLKVGELQFLEQKRGLQPLLLLDDIFSELDQELESMVLKLVDQYQTVMTTANRETEQFLRKKLKNLSVIEMEK